MVHLIHCLVCLACCIGHWNMVCTNLRLCHIHIRGNMLGYRVRRMIPNRNIVIYCVPGKHPNIPNPQNCTFHSNFLASYRCRQDYRISRNSFVLFRILTHWINLHLQFPVTCTEKILCQTIKIISFCRLCIKQTSLWIRHILTLTRGGNSYKIVPYTIGRLDSAYLIYIFLFVFRAFAAL